MVKGICMIKGYSNVTMSRLALGTHLGDTTDAVSGQYREAIAYAIQNGITAIDGAINYRGMLSEKDEGIELRKLIESGAIRREDFCITSKAGLLFGDITERINPKMYFENILKPQGITEKDFYQYDGLYQTLNPVFFEIALEKSLQNLGLETIDIHYIHIPEISRSGMSEADFYDKMEKLFFWYEDKVKEGKIKSYGIALEYMGKEPMEAKWHFELEEIKRRADIAGKGSSSLMYVIFEYNIDCPYPKNTLSQTVAGEKVTLAEACHRLGLETVASMPFAMGDALKNHSVKELLEFALCGTDHVIVGSKNVKHIEEIMQYC